ncbi:MAG TPA: hypothetical protein VE379_08975 [Vicinamibacterales bacterium]|nr:hypothetical protein [Vicinamibacterales bacterium]
MKLDPRVVAIAKQFEPGLPIANWTDDNRRAWVMQVIEQVVFRFPDGGWGAKRSGPRRPLSKDSIALKRDGHVWAFDLVSVSTKRVKNTVEGVLIDDQVFVEVAGKDHLGMPTPGAGGDDPPSALDGHGPSPADDAAILQDLRAIAATLSDVTARLARLEEAASANRSALDALKTTVDRIAAAVSASPPGTRGNVPGT